MLELYILCPERDQNLVELGIIVNISGSRQPPTASNGDESHNCQRPILIRNATWTRTIPAAHQSEIPLLLSNIRLL
jgi:hypothetical protein